MNALQMDENISLVFTTVLDQLTLGLVDEDEDFTDVTDRSYWEKRGTKATVSIVDDLLDIINTFEPSVELKYNKFYIGLSKDGKPNNFAIFRPKKKFVRAELRLPKEEETETKIEEAGLDLMEYSRSGRTRIKLTKKEIKEKREFLTELIKMAHDRFNS